MSGTSLPTRISRTHESRTRVLIPDEWGKSSDIKKSHVQLEEEMGLNPRLVGQVFRLIDEEIYVSDFYS